MMANGRSSVLLLVVALGLTGSAVWPETPRLGSETSERRPRRDAAALRSLPAETQKRIRQLDRDLHKEDPEMRTQLFRAMQRYAEWLERLPPEDRRLVEEAKSPQEKVQRIREIREQQWIATLPKADRDRLAAAKAGPERQELIARIRKRESDRDLEGQLLQVRLEDQQEIRRWLKTEMPKWRDELIGKLTPSERERLKVAETKKPVPVRLLVELAEKHDVPVPAPLQKLKLRTAKNPNAPKS
jgi:hypothetical protein